MQDFDDTSDVHVAADIEDPMGRTVRGIIDATSVLAANVEMILAASVGHEDPEMLEDTRKALEQVVVLARHAQKLRERPYHVPAAQEEADPNLDAA
jgi:hypothetical protein